MVIDRKMAPEVKQISSLDLIPAEKSLLDNGLPLYSINAGSQDLVKIEFLFDAGSKFE